ncbi:MAG TPA: hypothetical protein DDY51_13580, partial [Erwinia persicina]|nr:hypothetical protein [Erwinia persicina]
MKNENGSVYVVATADTKGRELFYVRDLIVQTGVKVVTVDLSTQPLSETFPGDIPAEMVADYHPQGRNSVFCGDRGKAIDAMAQSFRIFLS